MDPLFPGFPEDVSALSADEIRSLIDEYTAQVDAVTADPGSFVTDELSSDRLYELTEEAVGQLKELRVSLTVAEAAEAGAEVDAEAFARLRASVEEEGGEEGAEGAEGAEGEEGAAEGEEGSEGEEGAEEESEEVVAAAAPVAVRRAAPARSRRAAPVQATEERELVALVAGAGASDLTLGTPFPNEIEIAKAMESRRAQFGLIPEGTRGEKITIARASWSHLYPKDRELSGDMVANEPLIQDAVRQVNIKSAFQDRRRAQLNGKPASLVASGGLCAPVTPYYNLQMVSVADRPVRAALASFNADRGGIRYAQPATLASITTGVGLNTAHDDAAGGTLGAKTCQTVDCPSFVEQDVDIIYHCLKFGNLGARTFPERVAQWNNLTLAAHSRLAESNLLTQIDLMSTQVTATDLSLGATAAWFGQLAAAANGMRNRHRMDPEAVLRVMMPDWAVDLLISDVIRSQFERFDTDEAKITALIRSFDIEPTFYIDGANNRNQVFGSQAKGALLPFPPQMVWYLYPEGSFLYLDGGTLELGLVRDSVLNSTNDFEIFGETFENVAFVGVESLAVASTICDSGAVSLPHLVDCPIDYLHTSG